MDFTVRIAKTKTLTIFAVTAKLICVFVFAYAKSRFSHNEAHMYVFCSLLSRLDNKDGSLFRTALFDFGRYTTNFHSMFINYFLHGGSCANINISSASP